MAVNYCPGNLVSRKIHHRSTSFPSKHIIKLWQARVGSEELGGGLEPIRNGKIFWIDNNNTHLPLHISSLGQASKKLQDGSFARLPSRPLQWPKKKRQLSLFNCMVSLIILIHHFSTYRLDLFYDEIQLLVQLEWVIPGWPLYDGILPKQEWTLHGVTTEMKPLQQYFHMVLFFSK